MGVATTLFLTALIRSRQTILDSTFPLFESASKPTGSSLPHQSLPTLRLLDPAATLVIGPHQFHGTKLSVINRQFDEVQPNGSADASTSTHTPLASTAIIVEFKEAPTEKYILPDHFTCAVLSSSPSDRRQHLILSLFVFVKNGIVGKGKGKANEGVEDLEIPIPIDVVVEVEDKVAEVIRNASRSSRPRDEALERWWLNTIASVPSRISTIKGVEPDPIPIEPLVMSPSTTREDSASLDFSVAGPLAKAQRPNLLTSRSSSPIGMKEKKPISGKANKRVPRKSNLGTSSLPPSPAPESIDSASETVPKKRGRGPGKKWALAAVNLEGEDGDEDGDEDVVKKRKKKKGRGPGKKQKIKVEESVVAAVVAPEEALEEAAP